MLDLLTPLEPPPEPQGLRPGELRGIDAAALLAAMAEAEVWAGAQRGWLRIGQRVGAENAAVIIRHQGRMTLGISFEIVSP